MTDNLKIEFGVSDELIWNVLSKSVLKLLDKQGSNEVINAVKILDLQTCKLPSIDQINEKLTHIGWTVYPVNGFVSSKIFFSNLANRSLPISITMRSWSELNFSVEPDYFHEAFGHLALLGSPALRDFLKLYGEIGKKCFSYEGDEAYLQLLSNNIDSRKAMADKKCPIISHVEKSEVSELVKLTRLGWWTFETGLVLENDQHKAWGAAIISSITELKEFNSKPILPLTLDCIWDHFDPSVPQNHFYSAFSFTHANGVLKEFEASLACNTGGYSGCLTALKSKKVCKIRLSDTSIITGEIEYVDEFFATIKNSLSSDDCNFQEIPVREIVGLQPT